MAPVTPSPTPNPNAFKFTLEGHVFDGPISFSDAAAAQGTGFAEELFQLPGVVGLFATANFVTITKNESAEWDAIVAPAAAVLERHF